MEKASTNNIKRQADIERLAREADKVLGITNALDWSIMRHADYELQDFGGAFTAAEDIAKGLSRDLIRMADEMASEMWAEDSKDDEC